MKPYTKLKNALFVINELKNELPYSKDKVKNAKRINTLLDALKSFDDMLAYKYRTDAIETLIYALIYEYLLQTINTNELPIHSIVYNIENSINNGSQQKKAEVISILKHHEMKNKIENSTVFDKDYINFDVLLKDLVNNFKQSVQWNLIK
jgi:hypothetical protein